MPSKQLTGGVISEYDKTFPEMPTKTLATLIFKENSVMFSNVESVRSQLRYYRGQLGDTNRKFRSKAVGKPVDRRTFNYAPFSIPKSENMEWEHYVLPSGDHRILCLSDIHLPYHDEKALELAINYGLKNNCTTLFINGDLMDCYQLSRFEKDARKRSFGDEMEMTRDFLKECKKHFQHVYFKIGNHEERYERFLAIKAPELLGVQDFKLSTLLREGEIGFHIIEDKRIVKAGHLDILHGHEFFGGTSQAVNPARGLYLKANESCIIGHLHKSSEHTETSLSGKIITTWSTGCLCYLHPEYARINKWNHGFADIELQADGTYHIQNKRIYGGKIL